MESLERDIESRHIKTPVLCAHARMIDNVRAEEEPLPGKVRCVECGAIIDDPRPER